MQKLNIFIVEDEPILAKLLTFTLQRMGHVICGSAECYADAIKSLDRHKADLVISDIMLIGSETGLDVARYNKANMNIPFMFLSSITDEALIAEAMSLEPVSFLKKPVALNALNEALSMFGEMLTSQTR